jgi:tetrahydromethanopterin S-methyltransferase subunit A
VLANRVAPSDWPVRRGTYRVADPTAPVAVCVLTSEELIEPAAALAGVAICGSVQTANVGLEAIVLNTISNKNLRFLVVCGKDSKLFLQGQSLIALHANGVDKNKSIVGAEGYEPMLAGLATSTFSRFREQIRIIDLRGIEDLAQIEAAVAESCDADPRPLAEDFRAAAASSVERIRPGGSREPLAYDPKGFFVITTEPESGEICVTHFGADRVPAHEMRGRTAEPMLLGLLRERLVTQLSHAGYLGAELAKAEASLRLDLPYTQDRPLPNSRATALTRQTKNTTERTA